jgi:thiopeptide-type bacteriocin biosynthesis protein
MIPKPRRWLSLHMPCEEIYSTECDRLIAEAAGRVWKETRCADLASLFFFVRYVTTEPHLRLRVLPRPGAEATTIDCLLSVAYDFRISGRICRWVPYVPEYDRYGGRLGVATAEELFDLSTKVALASCSEWSRRGFRSAKAGDALVIMCLVWLMAWRDEGRIACEAMKHVDGYCSLWGKRHAFESSHSLKELFADRARSTSSYVGEALTIAGECIGATDIRGATPSPDVVSCRRLINSICAMQHSSPNVRGDNTVSASRAINSVIHMHLNRLGLTVCEEVELAMSVAIFLRADSASEYFAAEPV